MEEGYALASSARLSPSTLTPGSPRKPSERSARVHLDQRKDFVELEPPRLCDPPAWRRAFAGVMCGSRPEPELVTASIGSA